MLLDRCSDWCTYLDRYWFNRCAISSGISASCHILSSFTSVGQGVEQSALLAAVHPWTSLQTQVINLTVLSIAVELEVSDSVGLGLWRTRESNKSFSIAIGDHVRPFAAVRFLGEGQTLRAVEHESASVDAVHELTTVDTVSHFEVTELMGTLVAGLRSLEFGAVVATDVNWVLAREVFWAEFVVEQKTVWAELFLGHAIEAFDVGVALSSDGKCSIGLRALG